MILERPKGRNAVVRLLVFVPLAALLAAVPLAWGWGLSWVDIGLAALFYFVTCVGVTLGFHRYFTHRAFKADRPMRVALAIAGSLAFQGPIITWVADHRPPRLHRQGGRSALAVAVRHEPGGGGQRFLALAFRLDARARGHQPGPLRP